MKKNNSLKSHRKPIEDLSDFHDTPIEMVLKFKAGDLAFKLAMQAAGYRPRPLAEPSAVASIGRRFATMSHIESSSALADC